MPIHDKDYPFYIIECEYINTISQIFKPYSTHDRASFNYIIYNPVKCKYRENTMLIALNNIDGNASNFDAFIIDLSQSKNKFSDIGIAETNID